MKDAPKKALLLQTAGLEVQELCETLKRAFKSKPSRRRQREGEQNNGAARASRIAVQFLCRPLQNSNLIEWQSHTHFRERVLRWLIFLPFVRIERCFYIFRVSRFLDQQGIELNRYTQLRHSRVKYKYYFWKASSSVLPSSLLKLPNDPGSREEFAEDTAIDFEKAPVRILNVYFVTKLKLMKRMSNMYSRYSRAWLNRRQKE